MGLVGLEPPIPRLSRRCSNQLSYRSQAGRLQCRLGPSSLATTFQQPISVSVVSFVAVSRKEVIQPHLRYGYLVTTFTQSRTLPW